MRTFLRQLAPAFTALIVLTVLTSESIVSPPSCVPRVSLLLLLLRLLRSGGFESTREREKRSRQVRSMAAGRGSERA